MPPGGSLYGKAIGRGRGRRAADNVCCALSPFTTLLPSVQERIKRRSKRLEFSRRTPAPRPTLSMRAARTRILPARSSWKDPKSLDTIRSATAWGVRSRLSRRATVIGRAVAGP